MLPRNAEAGGGSDALGSRGLGATRLRADRTASRDVPISGAALGGRAAAAAVARVWRTSSGALAIAAGARGLAGEPQAGLPPLPAGRVAAEAAAQALCGRATAAVAGLSPVTEIGHQDSFHFIKI